MTARGRMFAAALVALVVLVASPSVTRAAASAQLGVTAQPALYPAFAPTINYYVTSCADAPVHLTVTAPTGTTVTVDAQQPQSGTSFSTQVNLLSGQEFLIRSTANGATQTYHVRCLPSDFPTWTSTQSASKTQTKYFVVTPDIGQSTPYVAVFDTNGVPRWWYQQGPQPVDAKRLANGDLVWTENTTGAPYQEHALDGSLVRTYAPVAGRRTDIHELQVLSNGNYFLFGDTQRTMDLSPCGGPTSASVFDPIAEEHNSSGQLLWSWDPADYIPISVVSPGWYSQCAANDPYHANAIEYVGDGTVLISFRHLDAIYKVSLSTKAIVWKLGGIHTSNSLTILGDPDCPSGNCQDFGGQHDNRIYTDPSGKTYLTLHDNGSDRSRAPRTLRFLIDPQARTATLVETVADSNVTTSICCGSARKLPGGNWLVGWGGTPTVDEVQPSSTGGNVIFSLKFDSVFSYRAAPVTDASYGGAMTAGMNAQYPRAPQGGGPASGPLLAWGLNASGQLGNGTTTNALTPVPVNLPSGTKVSSVAVADDFSLALTSTGGVLAWGSGGFGQLGNGTLTSSTTPVAVKLPTGTKVTAIAAGSEFALALTSAGKVLAWGYNAYGDLGNGTYTNTNLPTPVSLPAGATFSAVSAGFNFGLALTSTGQVWGWGYNGGGELGTGSPTLGACGCLNTPVQAKLPTGTTVTAISAGENHSLALTSSGGVLAWGAGGDGQLGYQPLVNNGALPHAVELPAGTTITAVSAGWTFSLAITSAGRVLAWGNNAYGELGNGTTSSSKLPVTVSLSSGTVVTAIAAEYVHSVALTSTGGVLAWGAGAYGKLGNGTSTGSTLPVKVTLPAGTIVRSIASGFYASHSLAIY